MQVMSPSPIASIEKDIKSIGGYRWYYSHVILRYWIRALVSWCRKSLISLCSLLRDPAIQCSSYFQWILYTYFPLHKTSLTTHNIRKSPSVSSAPVNNARALSWFKSYPVMTFELQLLKNTFTSWRSLQNIISLFSSKIIWLQRELTIVDRGNLSLSFFWSIERVKLWNGFCKFPTISSSKPSQFSLS